MILISPAEPPELQVLGTTSPAPELHGADFLVLSDVHMVAVQRKEFPGDFLSSLEDGRLQRELALLKRCPLSVWVREGYAEWDLQDQLVGRGPFRWEHLWGIETTMQLDLGVRLYVTRDKAETAQLLLYLESWLRKADHVSLAYRPKPHGEWGVATDRDWARHMLQSFPGIGVRLADSIYEKFGRVPLRWDVSSQDMLDVQGMGPVRVGRLWGAFDVVGAAMGNDPAADGPDCPGESGGGVGEAQTGGGSPVADPGLPDVRPVPDEDSGGPVGGFGRRTGRVRGGGAGASG